MKKSNRHKQGKIKLVPVKPGDDEFLLSVFASTRPDIQAMPLPQAQKERFLKHQYQAQLDHYRKQFPKANHDRVLYQNQSVGRLYVDRTGDPLVVVDITLIPAFQNFGIGSWLLRQIIEEADRDEKTIRLSVRSGNPALQWYTRLGFRITESDPAYVGMQKLPAKLARLTHS